MNIILNDDLFEHTKNILKKRVVPFTSPAQQSRLNKAQLLSLTHRRVLVAEMADLLFSEVFSVFLGKELCPDLSAEQSGYGISMLT